jgi:hypothetical protein
VGSKFRYGKERVKDDFWLRRHVAKYRLESPHSARFNRLVGLSVAQFEHGEWKGGSRAILASYQLIVPEGSAQTCLGSCLF